MQGSCSGNPLTAGQFLYDTSTFEVFVKPSFATIEFLDNSIVFAPYWSEIQYEYDVFVAQGLALYGDTFFLVVGCGGANKTIEASIDFMASRIDEYPDDRRLEEGPEPKAGLAP